MECECRNVLARRFDDAADISVCRQRVRSPVRAERRVHERSIDWPPANGADQGERRRAVAPVNRSPATGSSGSSPAVTGNGGRGGRGYFEFFAVPPRAGEGTPGEVTSGQTE